jgi:Leucine-rich repeat (LRR) protein
MGRKCGKTVVAVVIVAFTFVIMSALISSEKLTHPKVEITLKAIANGEKLTHVDWSDCNLTSLPEEIFQLRDSLVLLNLGNNNLSFLPENMLELQKLRILFFAQNKFKDIPVVLGKLSSLFMLSFKSNQIENIGFQSLSPSVCWLILTDNKIKCIPTSIGTLIGLKKLMLAGNLLTTLPEEMCNCQVHLIWYI